MEQVRAALRSCVAAVGLNASQYGGQSLRIGGATAHARCYDAPAYVIQRLGHWSADAYLRYLRANCSEHDRYVQGIADADVDDFTADYVAIDDHGTFDAIRGRRLSRVLPWGAGSAVPYVDGYFMCGGWCSVPVSVWRSVWF